MIWGFARQVVSVPVYWLLDVSCLRGVVGIGWKAFLVLISPFQRMVGWNELVELRAVFDQALQHSASLEFARSGEIARAPNDITMSFCSLATLACTIVAWPLAMAGTFTVLTTGSVALSMFVYSLSPRIRAYVRRSAIGMPFRYITALSFRNPNIRVSTLQILAGLAGAGIVIQPNDVADLTKHEFVLKLLLTLLPVVLPDLRDDDKDALKSIAALANIDAFSYFATPSIANFAVITGTVKLLLGDLVEQRFPRETPNMRRAIACNIQRTAFLALNVWVNTKRLEPDNKKELKRLIRVHLEQLLGVAHFTIVNTPAAGKDVEDIAPLPMLSLQGSHHQTPKELNAAVRYSAAAVALCLVVWFRLTEDTPTDIEYEADEEFRQPVGRSGFVAKKNGVTDFITKIMSRLNIQKRGVSVTGTPMTMGSAKPALVNRVMSKLDHRSKMGRYFMGRLNLMRDLNPRYAPLVSVAAMRNDEQLARATRNLTEAYAGMKHEKALGVILAELKLQVEQARDSKSSLSLRFADFPFPTESPINLLAVETLLAPANPQGHELPTTFVRGNADRSTQSMEYMASVRYAIHPTSLIETFMDLDHATGVAGVSMQETYATGMITNSLAQARSPDSSKPAPTPEEFDVAARQVQAALKHLTKLNAKVQKDNRKVSEMVDEAAIVRGHMESLVLDSPLSTVYTVLPQDMVPIFRQANTFLAAHRTALKANAASTSKTAKPSHNSVPQASVTGTAISSMMRDLSKKSRGHGGGGTGRAKSSTRGVLQSNTNAVRNPFGSGTLAMVDEGEEERIRENLLFEEELSNFQDGVQNHERTGIDHESDEKLTFTESRCLVEHEAFVKGNIPRPAIRPEYIMDVDTTFYDFPTNGEQTLVKSKATVCKEKIILPIDALIPHSLLSPGSSKPEPRFVTKYEITLKSISATGNTESHTYASDVLNKLLQFSMVSPNQKQFVGIATFPTPLNFKGRGNAPHSTYEHAVPIAKSGLFYTTVNSNVMVAECQLSPSSNLLMHTANTKHGDCGSPIVCGGVVVAIHVGSISTSGYNTRNIAYPLVSVRGITTPDLDGDISLESLVAPAVTDYVHGMYSIYGKSVNMLKAGVLSGGPFTYLNHNAKQGSRCKCDQCHGGISAESALYMPDDEETKELKKAIGVVEDDMVHFPGNRFTIVKCLSDFVTSKHKYSPESVHAWSEAIPIMYENAVKLFVSRSEVPLQCIIEHYNADTQFDIVLSLLARVAAATTTCGYGKRLGLPVMYEDNKRGLYSWLSSSACPQKVKLRFLHDFTTVKHWLESAQASPGFNMPLHVFAKDEPITKAKALAHKHRSIQTPPLQVMLVEMLYSCLSSGKDTDTGLYILYTPDDIMKLSRACLVPQNKWMLGGNIPLELAQFTRTHANSYFINYDVEAWDRSLPLEVVQAVYATMLIGDSKFGKHVSRNLCHGLCGNGLYIYGSSFYRLPAGTTAWCSGALKTLSGNSLAHAALLTLIQQQCPFGMVQGDDGSLVSTRETDVQLVVDTFANVGMKLKRVERTLVSEFCALGSSNGDLNIDVKAMLKKAAFKHHTPCAESINGILQTTRIVNPYGTVSSTLSVSDVIRFTIDERYNMELTEMVE